MKKACSVILCLLLCISLQLGVFAESADLKTVVPSTHEITVSYNYGGYVLNDGRQVTNGETITVDRFADLGLDIICRLDSHIKSVTINGEDVTDLVINGQLNLTKIHTDMDIVITFERCEDADHPTNPTNPDDPTKPTDPDDPTKPTDPDDPTKPTDPDDPTKPTDPDDKHEDPCTHLSMSGNVYLGEDPFPGAHLDIDGFGEIVADADEEGQYAVEEIKDGFHIVTISDENGEIAGTSEFAVTVDADATEVTVTVLEDGTQLVTVPEGAEHIYLDFIVNAEDGTITIVPGKEPVVPEEPTTGTGVGSLITDNPIITKTGALIREYPLAAGTVFMLTFFLLLFVIARKKDEDDDEEPTRA